MDAETRNNIIRESDAVLAELADTVAGLQDLYRAAYRGELRPYQDARDEGELIARLDAAYARFSQVTRT